MKIKERRKKMKTKTKIKFDINETIRRLNEISKGFEASANRIQVIVEDAEKKKQEAHEQFMKG
jgi:adenosine/AMP kinase